MQVPFSHHIVILGEEGVDPGLIIRERPPVMHRHRPRHLGPVHAVPRQDRVEEAVERPQHQRVQIKDNGNRMARHRVRVELDVLLPSAARRAVDVLSKELPLDVIPLAEQFRSCLSGQKTSSSSVHERTLTRACSVSRSCSPL